MTVMRSVFYIPGNNEKMISKAPETPADIITLDLEDSVPPAEKAKAREMVRENLKYAGSGGSTVYVRLNNWETLMTNDDLEAIVYEGLSGVCLAKCGGAGSCPASRLEIGGTGATKRTESGKHRHPAPHRNSKRGDECLSFGHCQQAGEFPYLRRS